MLDRLREFNPFMFEPNSDEHEAKRPLAELDNADFAEDATEEVGTDYINTEKISKSEIKLHLKSDDYLVDLSEDVAELVYTLEINGVSTFPKGEIQMIKGKAKQGKTHAILCIMTALLRGEFIGIHSKIDNPKVCYFATEEHKRSVQMLVRKVHTLCRWPTDENDDNFLAYTLRTMTPKERSEYIEAKIKDVKPDIVFIDGIRDLLNDFNNIEESNKLATKLMQWSTLQDCSIINVIHTNKGQSDSNMRGHLGSELLNKCTNTLEVYKQADVFVVEETDSRNIPTGKWAFKLNENGLMAEGEVPIQKTSKKNGPKKRVETMKQNFSKILSNSTGLAHSQLLEKYIPLANVKGTTAVKHIKEMLDSGFLNKKEKKYGLS